MASKKGVKSKKGGKPPKAEEKEKKSAASSTQEKIKELEKLISETKYNKRTQAAIGGYKAQLAKLKTKEHARKGTGVSSEGYSVRKTGDGTVVLLGFPSVGKSTLLNRLTNAKSETGAYAFTTLTVIPGLMQYKHAKIQVLDVPGIVEGAASGRGRGKEVLAVVRNADLIMLLIDPFQPKQYNVLLREVYDVGVRLNKRKPDVKIKKTAKGGISVGATVPLTKIDGETVKAVMREMSIVNADVVLRDDIDTDELIDSIEGNKNYINSITVVNKMDLLSEEKKKEIEKSIKPDLFISAHEEINIGVLKDLIFDRLDFIRIYLKEVGKKADMEEPLIMFKGSTIRKVCEKLHKDFVKKFKFARIWGPSAKFDGQMIRKLDKELVDEDVLEVHLV